MERELRIMRDMGANAIRTSHNPPAPGLLELCDRLGLVVWDEAFDKWDTTADLLDRRQFEPFMERQVANFVRRDRNHPCVVIWSIGNEIGDILSNRYGDAPEKVAFMHRLFQRHDPSRPTTMGNHITGAVAPGKHILDALDCTGWNYDAKYRAAKKRYPDKPVIYSESASAFSTRGFYRLPLETRKTDYPDEPRQISSYDHNSASWSDVPDVEFRRMELDRYVAGEFVWTGFDYLGEPTPYSGRRGRGSRSSTREASRSSYFGIVDLAGLPKDRFYLYRSYWAPEKLTIHLLPHWNWKGREGQPVPVYVYTSGDTAELFLNGRSLGRRTKRTEETAPVNLALHKPATASSEEIRPGKRNVASLAFDGDNTTRWCASTNTFPQTLEVDLGTVRPLRACTIEWEMDAGSYQFKVEASDDAQTWRELGNQSTARHADQMSSLAVDTAARYLRIVVTGSNRGWASIQEFACYDQPVRPHSYYDVLDRYRLRWLDVLYEPGELKAVAYKNGVRLGETSVRTAGPPTRLRLTPDRTQLIADGDDLAFVRVEMLDAVGTLCPKSAARVRFTVEGPATIAGIDNGDPQGLDSFADAQHPLFFGKAVVILRMQEGRPGTIVLHAQTEGSPEASAQLRLESHD